MTNPHGRSEAASKKSFNMAIISTSTKPLLPQVDVVWCLRAPCCSQTSHFSILPHRRYTCASREREVWREVEEDPRMTDECNDQADPFAGEHDWLLSYSRVFHTE